MRMLLGYALAVIGIALFVLFSMAVEIVRAKVIVRLKIGGMFIATATLRILRPWCEGIVSPAHEEMQAWSNRYVWSIAVFQISAFAIFIFMISGELSLWGLVIALLIYPLVVCALSISLLWKLPSVRACWDDVSVKIMLFGCQLIGLYLAKGMANSWLGELWGVSAANIPMAHSAATAFAMLLGMSILLLPILFIFEVLFMFSLISPAFRGGAGRWEQAPVVWRSSSLQKKERQYQKGCWRRNFGVVLVTVATFFSCAMAMSAGFALFGTHVANTFLAAVAFELDAVPAQRCELSKDADRVAATKKDPDVKALFLSSTQEKALIVRRAKDLYDPIILKKFNSEGGGRKGLDIGDAVICYQNSLSAAN